MKPQIGATYRDRLCQFTVWAPGKTSVHVVINAENSYPMKPDMLGYWTTELENIKPGDLYEFQLDEKVKRPDPASKAQPSGVHGPSEVIDLHGYQWNDENWKGLPLEDMIMYELHTGTFTPEHTFKGIINKLDYLTELGVNTIEIMPIAQFPGARNWGYDGVFPFAAHHDYGGPLGLLELVDACHQKGVAVVLDVVYNHFGPEGNYTNEYGPYFTDKYQTPWGKALNFDDAYCDGVRDFFIQNALMWLRDFHIDGLRLDAVHAIKDFSAQHFLAELSKEVKQLEEETGRAYTLIGECDLNDNKFISPVEERGYGLSGQWIDEFHHALRSYITKESDGYYEDFGTLDHLFKAFEKTYVYNGNFSEHRKKFFGSSAEGHPYSQFVVFSQNHDQVGNRMMGDRISTTVDFETLKLMAAATILSPYVPMLFMGEEYAETNPFQYFVSHTDPDLVQAVRDGRRREFAYFHKEGQEVPDPQSEKTFQESSLSWDFQSGQQATMLKFYKMLISIRKEHPAFVDKDRGSMKVKMLDHEVILLTRNSHIGGNRFTAYCLFNFSDKPATVSLPQNLTNINLQLDSADEEWGGPGQLENKMPEINLQRRSVTVVEGNE